MRKIVIVTDYVCNNECISCARKSDEKGSLSIDQIIEKLDLIQPSKEDYIELSGGEPTLREDLFDICAYIKANFNTSLIMLSNGRKFNDKSFAKKIKEVGVDRVMTAFYSHREEIHDSITKRKGSFLETVSGLKNLEEIGIPISVKTIVLKQNYQQLSDFVRFAYDTFPSAWVSIHGLIMRGDASDNREEIVVRYKDMKMHIEDALDEAIKRDKNLGIFIIPSCTIDPVYWPYLGKNWKHMTHEMIYVSPETIKFGNLDVAQPDYCSECMVSENCSWAWESAWKEYTKMFGSGELSKVTASQLRYSYENNKCK